MSGAQWHRTPFGYLSADGAWFIERGGEWEGPNGGVDPTRHMWLVWRLAEPADYDHDEAGRIFPTSCTNPVRPMPEVTGRHGDDPSILFCHEFEEGWLSDAKRGVEIAREKLGRTA